MSRAFGVAGAARVQIHARTAGVTVADTLAATALAFDGTELTRGAAGAALRARSGEAAGLARAALHVPHLEAASSANLARELGCLLLAGRARLAGTCAAVAASNAHLAGWA